MEIPETWFYPCPSGLKDCRAPQEWNVGLNYFGASLSFVDMAISILLLVLWSKNTTLVQKRKRTHILICSEMMIMGALRTIWWPFQFWKYRSNTFTYIVI